ncbi:MAG TPA: aminodeoxychorismate synthase component I [Anaeromyxobacteraceae bacterium]|nr:aminodeoxychorismate synthase component I [Anaeromyxobacteraceae bacterium]
MRAPFRARVDFPGLGPLGFERPVDVIEARAPGEVPRVLHAVERAARDGLWAVGHVAYEAAPAFDPALRAHPPQPGPVAVFGLFERPVPLPPPSPGALGPLVPEIDRGEHARGVAAIREALAAGGAYQVNLTFRLRGRFEGDPLGLYERLLRGQGECHGACVVAGERAVVSASPELFFERRGDAVLARPMKGTRPRGRFAEEDARFADELRASEKERAENVMIVDLLRNDLGRVAVPGSVRATDVFRVERYRTVHQLVSTVEARVAPGVGLASLFGALFPCGSVTGAPKVAATGIIAGLERSPRGAYCGAVGVVRPGGDAAFSVAIRTVELDLASGAAACGVGGGITWGSDAGDEWREALAKGEFLLADDPGIALVETLRLERGAYPLLERHLARLAESARHLGLAVDPAAARAALARQAAESAGASRRVRLVARADGIEAGSAPLPEPATAPLPVALARRPVSRWDRRLFHKTTRREPYELRRAEVPGTFDVILWNEEGELTELTIGNLVVELDGVQVTPPRECGLLAGVMRAELLARGEVREATLRAGDLARATRLWLVNAVRGRVPVRLVG